jgi:F-type H+-transporting ATPase subunit b
LHLSVRLAESGLLDLNGSLIAEVIAFLIMLAILSRWVYPPIVRAAEARQRQVAEQLEAAEKARQEAEARLRDAEERLAEARSQAQEIITGASRSGEQLRSELREKADEEARRLTEKARQDIEAERQRAVDSVRGEVAGLVVAATEKVIGESLDGERHRRLIDSAIAEVEKGVGALEAGADGREGGDRQRQR